MIKKRKPETVMDSFLLPNLCDYQAVLILMIAAQLLVIALVVFDAGLGFDWTTFGMVTLYVQWQSLCSAAVLCLSREYLATMPKHKGVMLAYAELLIIGLVLSIMVQYFFQPANLQGFNWNFVLSHLLISAIVIGIALRYLYLQQQLLDREKSVLMANLSALQARIKPHFLFNTMNSIASLISISPEKAELVVEDLAGLLRASLREDVVETSLADEWEICEKYLKIEKTRLGDRLQWDVDFSSLPQQVLIPSLSLQPIVENAIYHGIQPNPDGGYLKVKGALEDQDVVITVENSQLPGLKADRGDKGNRMAITNIRHRIKQLYGESASLILEDKGDIFLVTLRYRSPEPFDEEIE